MKRNYFLNKLLLVLGFPVLIMSCDSDDDNGTSASDFAVISTHHFEANGPGTVTIPFRGDLPNDVQFVYDGSATEGEDYEVVGMTDEGLQINIIDDSKFEPVETIRVQMTSPSVRFTGNNIHTVTIVSNCEDTDELTADFLAGHYDAVEDYGSAGTYGPYEIDLVQDDEDPNMFHFDNLYDSGCDAYMIFDVAAKTVYFPDQEPCGVPLTNSSGTFEYNVCEGAAELTINLNFDGGDWVYRVTKL